MIFERAVKNEPQPINKSITLAQYAEIWLRDIAPQKLAKSTMVRDRREVERFLPYLGHHKLKDLRADMFREFYAKLRTVKNQLNGNLLAEASIEGTHYFAKSHNSSQEKLSKQKDETRINVVFMRVCGTPDAVRTHDPSRRRHSLCPLEW